MVDTFELAEHSQRGLSFMSEANTARVEKQKEQQIFVVVGNPPYNAAQNVENDNNKNRRHPQLHSKIWSTYAAGSKATLLNTLNDPYIQAFRWATDRLEGRAGIVAFVTNSGFLTGRATDSMRRSLAKEFDKIFIVDLGGDVRSNPKISGTTHNVFGIQAGVAITVLVRTRPLDTLYQSASIQLVMTGQNDRRQKKLSLLDSLTTLANDWKLVRLQADGSWILGDTQEGFTKHLEMGSIAAKKQASDEPETIFKSFTNGSKTNRDRWAFNFDEASLQRNIVKSIEFYNSEIARLPSEIPERFDVDKFVAYDDRRLSWSGDLKSSLLRKNRVTFSRTKLRSAIYRPFTSEHIFFDRVLNNRVYLLPSVFGESGDLLENYVIGVISHLQVPFGVLAANRIPSLDFGGRPTQLFPFYTYSKDGTKRRENITDWALTEFRSHYTDNTITKWDIFNATYAILHHPEYRTRYAANLKRELPRIPFPPDFHTFARAGIRLMELHIDYEKQPEYKLEQVESETAEVSFRVTRMKLSKDKSELRYNDFLTLRGIPLDVGNYRLGNRSALEWVIDQYRVTTDPRSGITNDPNREDDPQYILRLIGQVITVSLETNQIIAGLPSLQLGSSTPLTPDPPNASLPSAGTVP